jgi:hypothetical protein
LKKTGCIAPNRCSAPGLSAVFAGVCRCCLVQRGRRKRYFSGGARSRPCGWRGRRQLLRRDRFDGCCRTRGFGVGLCGQFLLFLSAQCLVGRPFFLFLLGGQFPRKFLRLGEVKARLGALLGTEGYPFAHAATHDGLSFGRQRRIVSGNFQPLALLGCTDGVPAIGQGLEGLLLHSGQCGPGRARRCWLHGGCRQRLADGRGTGRNGRPVGLRKTWEWRAQQAC